LFGFFDFQKKASKGVKKNRIKKSVFKKAKLSTMSLANALAFL